MQNLILSPISISDFDDLLTSAVERVIKKYLPNVTQAQTSTPNNYGTVKWFGEVRHLAVPTVYSQLSKGEIPKDLYQKPVGTKRVLFFKDKVLNWINAGCPALENIHNSK